MKTNKREIDKKAETDSANAETRKPVLWLVKDLPVSQKTDKHERIRQVLGMPELTKEEVEQIINLLDIMASAAWAIIEKDGEVKLNRGTLFESEGHNLKDTAA